MFLAAQRPLGRAGAPARGAPGARACARPHGPRGAALATAAALALTAVGCGEPDAPRPAPPPPVTLSASITPVDVTVSPSRIGAGEVELVVANQTGSARSLRLRGEGAGATAIDQRTGPINPGDTTSLQADLGPGRYRLAAAGAGIAPAVLVVGPPRRGTGDRLLAP